MIYFVHAAELNAVKIGVTNDPQRRLDMLRTGSPVELEIIAVEEGDQKREAELHRQFALLRKRGEWFDYADTLRAYVATLEPFEKQRKRKQLGGKLGAWLFDNSLTIAEFAPRVGVSHATVSRICAGGWMPSADLMEKIAHATHGAVLPNDWFDLSALELREEGAA